MSVYTNICFQYYISAHLWLDWWIRCLLQLKVFMCVWCFQACIESQVKRTVSFAVWSCCWCCNLLLTLGGSTIFITSCDVCVCSSFCVCVHEHRIFLQAPSHSGSCSPTYYVLYFVLRKEEEIMYVHAFAIIIILMHNIIWFNAQIHNCKSLYAWTSEKQKKGFCAFSFIYSRRKNMACKLSLVTPYFCTVFSYSVYWNELDTAFILNMNVFLDLCSDILLGDVSELLWSSWSEKKQHF